MVNMNFETEVKFKIQQIGQTQYINILSLLVFVDKL